jgi:methyl coenzyme M reductase alpha subunit
MSDPRPDAARDRVAAIFDQLSRMELQVVVVAPPDVERRAARERARDAAIVAGRGPLLNEAVQAARDATIRVFARGGFSGTWAATDMAVSVVRASDRVAAEAALEEAVIAAIAEDLVDLDTLEVLRSTWDELARLRGIPSPGSLAALAAPAAGTIRAPIQALILAAAVLVLAAVGLGAGVRYGLIIPLIIVPLVIVAVLARRWRQPGS